MKKTIEIPDLTLEDAYNHDKLTITIKGRMVHIHALVDNTGNSWVISF